MAQGRWPAGGPHLEKNDKHVKGRSSRSIVLWTDGDQSSDRVRFDLAVSFWKRPSIAAGDGRRDLLSLHPEAGPASAMSARWTAAGSVSRESWECHAAWCNADSREKSPSHASSWQ